MGSIAFLGLWLISDLLVGPYGVPDILPENIERPASTYGNELYEDNSGNRYVIHLESGAKVYNPILYDLNRPFELRWTSQGIELRNALNVQMKVKLPAGRYPNVKAGSLDSVLMALPNMPGGYYYLNRFADRDEQGWENLGEWPPSEKTRSFWRANYDVENMEEECVFVSHLSNRVITDQELASTVTIRKSLLFTIGDRESAEIEMEYVPLRKEMSRDLYPMKKVSFLWGGALDLNFDGEVNDEDYSQFLSWWEGEDERGDWNADGVFASEDIALARERFFPNHADPDTDSTPANPPVDTDEGGFPRSSAASGCGLSPEHHSHQSLWVALASFVLFLGLYRRRRKKGLL